MVSAARYVLGLARDGAGAAGGPRAGVLSLVDLSRVVVVVPGRRAARVMHAELLDRVRGDAAIGAERAGLAPPRIVTPGQAAGVLARAAARRVGDGAGDVAAAGGERAAPALVRRLAWVAALEETPRDEVRVFVPRVDEFAAEDAGARGDGARDSDVAFGDVDDGRDAPERGADAIGSRVMEIGGESAGREIDAGAQPWPLSGVAGMLMRASEELAGELLRFADVAERIEGGAAGAEGGRAEEAARWRAMAAVQERYGRALAAMGYADEGLAVMDVLRGLPMREDGRGTGAEAGIEAAVIVGVADASAALRRAMQCAAAAGVRVHAAVMSDARNADRFDDFGCVVPEMWVGGAGGRVTLDVPEEAIEIAGDADDQARRVMRALEGVRGRGPGGVVGVDEAAVVVPDEGLTPSLKRAAAGSRVRLRAAAGESLATTGPMRVLAGLLAILRDGDYAALASFVRLADVERWLLRVVTPPSGRDGRCEWWLREMDEHAQRTLPTALDALLEVAADMGGEAGSEDEAWSDRERRPGEVARRIAEQVAGLAARLKSGGGEGGGVAVGARAILACMAEVYGGRELSRDRADDAGTILALEELRDALSPMLGMEVARGRMSPAMLLSHVLSVLSEVPMPGEGGTGAVEMLGWLEASLDPSPVVVVTGVNEGVLPGGGVGDAMLPNGLRRALGMSHDAVRLARDTHLMESLLRTRRRVVLIAGKRTADGDPLRPSRLLFACPDDVLVRRLARWSGAGEESAEHGAAAEAGGGAGGGVGVVAGGADRTRIMPTVLPLPRVERMSVTAFRDYLASPYAFYVRHVLRLDEVGVPPTELDALAFGSLVHTVLDRFGRSDAAASTSDEMVRTVLLDELSTLVQRRLGRRRSPAVKLQISTAAERLSAFARVQAERARQGWRIAHCEWSPAAQAAERAARRAGATRADAGPAVVAAHPTLTAGDETMILTGKVDRIDVHEDGRWAIFDYKTGESQDDPEKAHRGSNGEWKDLQLPLYRHLIAELSPPRDDGQLAVGYIALPRDPAEVRIVEARWHADDYASADDAARGVILAVRAGRFAELGKRPPEDGPVAALCGIGYIGATPGAEDEQAEGEDGAGGAGRGVGGGFGGGA